MIRFSNLVLSTNHSRDIARGKKNRSRIHRHSEKANRNILSRDRLERELILGGTYEDKYNKESESGIQK